MGRRILCLPFRRHWPRVRGSGRQLLLLTDAEVEIADVEGWVGRMRSGGMRVSCLVLADGRGREALELLCRGTGGQVLMEADPRKWATAARELAGRVGPSRWVNQTASVQMHWPLPEGNREVVGWNAAWLRREQPLRQAVTGRCLGRGGGRVRGRSRQLRGGRARRPWRQWLRIRGRRRVRSVIRCSGLRICEGVVKVTVANGAPAPVLRVAAVAGGGEGDRHAACGSEGIRGRHSGCVAWGLCSSDGRRRCCCTPGHCAQI